MDVDEAMDNQALTFDAYPPDHPVAGRAAKGIEQLDARAEMIRDEIALLEGQRPIGVSAEEVEDMLNGIPDLRQAMGAATPDELAEFLEAFDVTARYNHLTKALDLTVVLSPELADTERPPEGGRRKSGIAGAGFQQTSATAYRFTETHFLG
jgi:hypothetical protein